MAQESNNIYFESLKLHLKYLEDLRKGTPIKIYFVEADLQITNNLPSEIDGLTIEYLDKEAIKKKGKQSQFHLIVIKPLELRNDKIVVNVIDYFVDYGKHNFNYANSGGSKLIFKYDCNKESYILQEKTQGGI
jgi:hypothetical protein